MEYIDWLFVFYMSTTSLFLMLTLYLPFLIWSGRLIYKRLIWTKRVKLPAIVLVGVLAFIAPIYDVIQTGFAMHYYCNNEHGEHIYKTVETKSIYGSIGGAREYLKEGYEFVEGEGLAGKLTRFHLSNGELVRVLIESPASKFEVQGEDIYLDKNIQLMNERIVNRVTGEILGEAKHYSAGYGWLDRITPDLGAHVFGCFKPPALGNRKFVLAVLPPAKE